MLYVLASISTKSTSAPQYRAQFALATKVIGLVQTKSPGPTPSAMHAKCNAEVALFTAVAVATPQYSATTRSKTGTIGPWVK
jgi:hypothetical protein